MLDVSSPPCGQQICTSLRHDWVAAGSRHTSTTWTALTPVTVAMAVFFNGGTRGYSHVSQKSATAYEKAIWEEFAYWHQAWRQKKDVRSETPNDGSSCTAAHHSKSFFLSLMNVTVLRYLMSPPIFSTNSILTDDSPSTIFFKSYSHHCLPSFVDLSPSSLPPPAFYFLFSN